MKTRIPLIALMLALVLALALTACAAETDTEAGFGPGTEDPSSEMRLANGLYAQEDGTVLALGTLEWVELEGGFYAITGSPESEGGTGSNIAVIANPEYFEEQLKSLLGKTVMVTGTRFEGGSIWMAGPEIIVDNIEEISDTPGIAE